LKKLLTTVALLTAMFAASPALAADDAWSPVFGYEQAFIYHMGCEKLPPIAAYGIVLQLRNIPEADKKAAVKKVTDALDSEGPTAWCARVKPWIDQVLSDEGLR
jgi:hypothetical protein